MKKRLYGVILFCLIMILLPLKVQAEEPTEEASELAKVFNGDRTDTLEQVFEVSVSGDVTTVKLLKDIDTRFANIRIVSSKKIVLDLNGFVLNNKSINSDGTYNGNSGLIYLTTNSEFTTKDSNPNKAHKFIVLSNKTWFYDGDWGTGDVESESVKKVLGGAITGSAGGAVIVGESSTFTMDGGTIVGNLAPNGMGAAVSMQSNGEFIMNSGNIMGNYATYGGNVYVKGSSKFTMNGGSITQNRDYGFGNVSVLDNSTFIMNAGEITCNEYWGVCVSGNSDFNMEAGSIDNNYGGGGVKNDTDCRFTMTGGSIKYNIFEDVSAGGVANRGTFTLGGNAVITGNKRVQNISGSNVETPKNLILLNSTKINISSSNAPQEGMHINVSDLSYNQVFTENAASEYGEYFYIDSSYNNAKTGYTEENKLKCILMPYVVFNMNGFGTAPETQVVEDGGTATRPSNPTSTEMVFVDWYKEYGCTNVYDFSTPVTSRDGYNYFLGQQTKMFDNYLYAGWKYLQPASVLGGENKITGVDSTMEYQLVGDSDWTAIEGTQVEGLLAGEYNVRVKKNGNKFASDAVIITVTDPDPSKPDAPTGVEGGVNVITGVDSTMEYRNINSSEWITIATNQIDNVPAGDYYIRIKADDTHIASDAVQVTVTDQNPSPDPDPEPEPEERYYIEDLEDQLNIAIQYEAGSDTTILWTAGDSLPQSVIDLILQSDVTVEFKFTYEGVDYDLFLNKNNVQNLNIPWYGPYVLAQFANNTAVGAEELEGDTYTVKEGDTMGAIAAKFGMSLEALAALNPQITDIDFIRVNQKIRVK